MGHVNAECPDSQHVQKISVQCSDGMGDMDNSILCSIRKGTVIYSLLMELFDRPSFGNNSCVT